MYTVKRKKKKIINVELAQWILNTSMFDVKMTYMYM